jgi:ABC-type transporter Mla subunit MlaD
MRRRTKPRITTFRAGALGILAIILISYLAYTKFANPFANHYTVHVVFSNANGLRPNSLVRIAGINVGRVTTVDTVSSCKGTNGTQSQCQASDVTMQIDDNGLPIHKDATFAIRPRIFLEGNFFIDVHPGTPEQPTAPDGYVFPIQQGVEPVQLDQVLKSLQSNTRRNLQILLQQYGKAVEEGGPAYNASIQFWLPAYEYGAIVSHDALGIQPHDLSRYIDTGGRFAGALDTHPQNLKSLITDFDTTARAFATQNVALQQALAELPNTLNAAIPAFNALNNAFPPLRAFARALLPGVQSTGPAVDASLPFISQLRLLVRPQELRGLVADLAPTVPALARLSVETIPFMRNQVRPSSSCVANVIHPWSQLTLPDPHFNASNGFPPRPVYVEAVDFLPGLSGESRVFDANGPYIRILGTGGTFTYSLQPGMFGEALAPITGVQPELPTPGMRSDHPKIPVARPPLMPSVACETQPAISDLSAPTGSGPQQVAVTDSPMSASDSKTFTQTALADLSAMTKEHGLALKLSSTAPTRK